MGSRRQAFTGRRNLPHPLNEVYQRLRRHFGPRNWWPGESSLEIMVGAVLTQNTSWGNVERAIASLKEAGLLPLGDGKNRDMKEPGEELGEDDCLAALADLPASRLAQLIRPSGYHNLKAGRLQNLLTMIHRRHGGVESFLQLPTATMRRQLLEVKGVGPETADSILLYAAQRPVFVVDAYTHRIFSRHQLLPEDADYHEIQEIFSDALPADHALYNEYHALIVSTGKEFCRKSKPRCPECPLKTWTP